MARELAKKEIDGSVYEFQKFGAKQSLKILVKLSKIAGKPLALAAGALKKNVDVTPELISGIVGSLTEKLDEDEAINLIETLTAQDNVLCDGKKIIFNSHYEDRLGHLFKVLSAALEVQYGNFFEEILSFLPTEQKTTTPVQSQSPISNG